MTSDSIPPSLLTASENDESKRPSSRVGGPGDVIRSARERARLTLEELAAQTKLARATLDALERDDFDALNEPVYVRGYYRKCAKVLSLSESDLISSYEKLVVPKLPQAPTKLLIGSGPTMGRVSLRRRGNGGRNIAVVIGAAILAAVVWFVLNDPNLVKGLRGTPSEKAPAATASSGSTTSAARPASELAASHVDDPAAHSAEHVPVAPSVEPAQISPPPSAAPAAASQSSAPAAAAATAPPTARPTTAPPSQGASPAAVTPSSTLAATPAGAAPAPAPFSSSSPGALTLQFKSTSWVRVEDAEGKLLLSGVIQGGDRQQVRGKPPYSLFVGNAPGVTVEYEGKLIDTAQFVKSNSTARFTLP